MKADIETRIHNFFSNVQMVKDMLNKLSVPEEERDRVVRCVLYLSDSDLDSLTYWIQKANEDRRDIYFFAEYDNKSERRWNFSIEFDKQFEYEYRNK